MITAVDPILYDLPFERFLSVNRDEEPDIDVDFDSDRREEVIQEVYRRYGRRNAAQVANVISYRPKSAVRDMAKALGYSTGQQDAWSKQIDSWGSVPDGRRGARPRHPRSRSSTWPTSCCGRRGTSASTPAAWCSPSGRWGRWCRSSAAGWTSRTVLQWDKDSCAWMGLVKFDFLGLGILAAIQYTLDLAADRVGERWTSTPSPRRSRASTTCSAGPTRSGCSRSRAGPRSAPCRGCSRAASTTWSSRSA